MDIFALKKLLVRIIIVLALLNLCSIGVFVWKVFLPQPRPEPEAQVNKPDASAILERELDLTGEQVDRFRNIRADFAAKEKQMVEAIREGRDSMNAAMFTKDTREDVVLSLARRIAENEYQMEVLRFEQAKKLKSVCTPDQVDKFEKLMREIRDFFRPDNQPSRKPKRTPPKRRE